MTAIDDARTASTAGRREAVRVFLDPADDATITADLLRRHDPPGGRVVVHPTPAATRTQELGHDLLAALGRPVNRLGAERLVAARPAWRAVAAWMQADRITELVVLRADRLTATSWSRLIDLCRSTGTRLTLVCHTQPIPPPLADTLQGIDHHVLTDPDPLGLPLPVPRRDDDSPNEHDGPTGDVEAAVLPRVTYPGVVNYRIHAFDRLGATEFARSDAVYQAAQAAVRAWLDTHSTPAESENGRETVMVLLTEIVHDSPSRTHTLARLHGAQAAFRRHGLKLTLPAPRSLLDVLTGPGLTSMPVTNRVADRIRAGVAHPVLAATLVTVLFTGMEPSVLAQLSWAALAPADDRLRINQRVTILQRPAPHLSPRQVSVRVPALFHVPPAARALLQAAHAFIQPNPHDNARRRLFAGTPPTDERIAAAAANCGLTLPNRPLQRAIPWQARLGIERVDYFGGPHDLHFIADQQFDPRTRNTVTITQVIAG